MREEALVTQLVGQWYPRQDSNLRSWLRRPVLYPLSYGGVLPVYPALPPANNEEGTQEALESVRVPEAFEAGVATVRVDVPHETDLAG